MAAPHTLRNFSSCRASVSSLFFCSCCPSASFFLPTFSLFYLAPSFHRSSHFQTTPHLQKRFPSIPTSPIKAQAFYTRLPVYPDSCPPTAIFVPSDVHSIFYRVISFLQKKTFFLLQFFITNLNLSRNN